MNFVIKSQLGLSILFYSEKSGWTKQLDLATTYPTRACAQWALDDQNEAWPSAFSSREVFQVPS